jgi:hypothetical protein
MNSDVDLAPKSMSEITQPTGMRGIALRLANVCLRVDESGGGLELSMEQHAKGRFVYAFNVAPPDSENTRPCRVKFVQCFLRVPAL